MNININQNLKIRLINKDSTQQNMKFFSICALASIAAIQLSSPVYGAEKATAVAEKFDEMVAAITDPTVDDTPPPS